MAGEGSHCPGSSKEGDLVPLPQTTVGDGNGRALEGARDVRQTADWAGTQKAWVVKQVADDLGGF